MASQEVLTALESLHREIEKLEPAIKHVETAQQVTQTVKAIPQKYVEFLQEVKGNDLKHKEELKNLFAKDLSKLSEENKKLQKTTTEIQQQVKLEQETSNKFKEKLLQEVKESDTLHKKELKDLFAIELASISDENKKLLKTTSELQQQVKLETEALAKLKETVQSFHERVEKINFPERLDKLDANVAGIMAAIQSVQSRLDGLERNISDRLRDMHDYQKETRATLQSGLEQTKTVLQTAIDVAAKKQQTLTYITWTLVVVAIIITFVLKK
jgi:chromosome segregation ATPase